MEVAFLLIHFIFLSTLRCVSQRCNRTEGVGGEAQAAAAGVCTQGEHPGHASCHQGARNARVHSTYLLLFLLLHVIYMFRKELLICLKVTALDAVR